MQFEIDGVAVVSERGGEQEELDSTFTLEERADELEATLNELQAKLRDDSAVPPSVGDRTGSDLPSGVVPVRTSDDSGRE